MDKNFSYYYMPGTTLIGIAAVSKIGDELTRRNAKKSLLVTDEFMAKSPVMKTILDILGSSGIETAVFDKVKPNPTMSQVGEGAKVFLSFNCDSIISLGGGSPHDCAKAVKLTLLRGRLTGLNRIPLMAINTTAGTASEITRFAIITDENKHRKVSIIDEDVIPDVAVDDPLLMTGMPPKLTAATGMDALTHAVEAFVAKGRNPVTDCTAIKAIELVKKFLLRAYKQGHDVEAREGMVYAQYLAGMSFSNAGLGLVHAMAHQLGGVYNLPHGVCNAVLLPYVVNYNSAVSYKCYAHIARTVNICSEALPDKTAAKVFVRYIAGLNRELSIPRTTKEIGVRPDDFETLANMAMLDPSLKMNPVDAKESDILKLYENSYKGNLDI